MVLCEISKTNTDASVSNTYILPSHSMRERFYEKSNEYAKYIITKWALFVFHFTIYVNGVELHKDDYLLRRRKYDYWIKVRIFKSSYDGKYTLTSVFKVEIKNNINTNSNVRRPEDNYIICEKKKFILLKTWKV